MSRKPEDVARQEEPEGGVLEPSEELEAALAEAVASIEERELSRQAPDPAASPAEAAEPSAASAAEVAALKDQLLRLHADFENLRRRTLKEREEAYRYGHENLVKDLLPTVDNLERAIEHARAAETVDVEGLLAGVELVLRDLQGVFRRFGVEEIEAEGKPFDPSQHEAVAQLQDDSLPASTVKQVFQRGYRLRGHLIRPAGVIVSKPSHGGGEKPGEPEAE